MEKQEPKKVWVMPELIVLVRNKPEEAVLSACKGAGLTSGPSDFDIGCIGTAGCPTCNSQLAS